MTHCAVDDCARAGKLTRGLCRMHYQRLRRTGEPEVSRQGRRKYPPQWQTFMAQVLPSDTGCWLWVGPRNNKGYGQFTTQTNKVRKAWQSHRYAYEQVVGPVPDGLDLDHLCRVRACVNPEHLEAVSHAENVRRGWASRRQSGEPLECTVCGASFRRTTARYPQQTCSRSCRARLPGRRNQPADLFELRERRSA